MGTMILTGWSKIRGMLGRIYSYFIVTLELDQQVKTAMEPYLQETFTRSRFGPKLFGGIHIFLRPLKRHRLIAFESFGGTTTTFRRGFKVVWVTAKDTDEDGNKSGSSNVAMTISYFRFMFHYDTLVREATKHWNAILEGTAITSSRRFFIRRIFGLGSQGDRTGNTQPTTTQSGGHSGAGVNINFMRGNRILDWEFDDLGPEISYEPAIGALALHEEVEDVVQEAERWAESKKWFKDRLVPWRRGWLLYGKPGTGKTALTRAIAEDFDLPVFIFDLASLSNSEMQVAWLDMLQSTPCIALFEDIDGVFNKRDNIVKNGGGLTFDCLLNCLDGVERSDGLFTIITTNRIETLDEALGIPVDGDEKRSTRPGRIDRVIEMKILQERGRWKLVKRILVDWPDDHERLVKEGDGDTGAQFQERCASEALRMFWDDKDVESEREATSKDGRYTTSGTALEKADNDEYHRKMEHNKDQGLVSYTGEYGGNYSKDQTFEEVFGCSSDDKDCKDEAAEPDRPY